MDNRKSPALTGLFRHSEGLPLLRQVLSLSDEDVEDILRVQVDQYEGQGQQHQADGDDLIELLDGQRNPVVPVLLLATGT